MTVTLPPLIVVLAAALWVIARLPLTDPRGRLRQLHRIKRDTVDVGAVAVELAERLRSGAPLQEAWSQTALSHGLNAEINGSLRDGYDGERRREEAPQTFAELGAAGRPLQYAWMLARDTGAPLADVLDAAADAATADEDARAARAIALAGPRSSARILSALPIVGLCGGVLLGVDVSGQVLGGGIGTASVVLGVALWFSGRLWTRNLISRASKVPPADHMLLDLAAAALIAGVSVPTVLSSLARITGQEDLAVAARGLLLGLPWWDAWQHSTSHPLAQPLEPAWTSGVGAVELLRRRARRMRSRVSRDAQEAAGGLASRLVLPLGACYLPSFIFLVLIPTILSISSPWWRG